MKTLVNIVFGLQLLLCGSIIIMAQDFPAFVARLERMVKEPQKNGISASGVGSFWETVYRHVDNNRSSHVWKSKRDALDVRTFWASSPQEAAGMLQSAFNQLSMRPVEMPKLSDLGDEAYIWSDVVYFRKGNVVVIVSATTAPGATSADLAKKYAQRIANLLDDK